MNSLPLPLALRSEIDILIVDDSRLHSKVLKDLLQSRAYQVRVAINGQEGLELAREKRPALIISDIVMPVMNGYDMCFALKQDPKLQEVPVILLTALSDPSDIVLGLTAQADYYLTKPYSEDFLLETITGILEQQPPPPGEAATEPLHVMSGGTEYTITSSRRQMLSLLLSTYGNAVEQNRILIQAQRELKYLNDQLREQAQHIIEQQQKLEEANTKLQALAVHDDMTKLKNRRAFGERFEEELQRAARYQQPLSLLLLDVDSFKQYNDSYGHPAGDEVLKTIARLLKDNSRETDLVARYGGEEFVVLLPNTDCELALHLAERLRASIEEEEWPRRAITASFGIATYYESQYVTDAGPALVDAADHALYYSKHHGRNRAAHVRDI